MQCPALVKDWSALIRFGATLMPSHRTPYHDPPRRARASEVQGWTLVGGLLSATLVIIGFLILT
ncbi:MAG TPA: hypothetical protein VM327_07210 [Candidatus Thermoplasmatota archaeon]|nr:hypothetical protein [Candidatus Thermoplasmatota archaeon]